VTADDDYLIRSVYDPDSELVQGYGKSLMKSYTGTLAEEDLKIIIEYLKTLSGQ
jgi:cytochrome c oxidase subunit 2